jgi:hypothetical protein
MTINNNNIFGAFTLNEARGSRLTGDWLNKESVANYGWLGGGGTAVAGSPFSFATVYSNVDRIDFSNDSISASSRGVLSSARYAAAATGNSNYGWFGGGAGSGISGFFTGLVSTVDRVDFSNDSSTASPRGSLSVAKYYISATGNSNYGWFGGGNLVPVSTVDRIDFSNDSATALARGSLSAARNSLAATGNSNYGWFGGGESPATPAPVSTINRVDFSNDFSTASPRGPLSSARGYFAATGNSNYGWFGGGYISTPAAIRSTIDRIDFSNDSSTASIRGPLSLTRVASAASGNSNYGWFGGGGSTPAFPQGATYYSRVDRIDFSNDTSTASVRGSLNPTARSGSAATSGVLNIRRQKAGNYGWFGGGYFPGITLDRIDFSNDSATASLRTGTLSLARDQLAATGNSNYGWFGGGKDPAPAAVSRIDRIDFSNDSATASVRGPLSSVRYAFAATGNSNYGWFGGGIFPVVSTVDRINFSNDSSIASIRGTLNAPAGRYNLAATGNSNYGWFGGGRDTPTTYSAVYRIDFSNDSTTASIRGPLSLGRERFAATGNSNYGWFGGGAPALATVDRIDFSNDSSTALVRGPLNAGKQDLAATGNSNYGWFGGGTPGPVATVNRIDFSNDSSTASVRGPLSSTRRQQAAVSNTNK